VALIPRNPKATLNVSNIPGNVYDGCSPTEGNVEVISPLKYSASAEHWVAVDIIAATSFLRGAFSIDEHDMYVYAVDGSYIEPQKVQALDFTNGDRYSVLVKADRPGAYKIRVSSTSALQMITGYAILSVGGLADDRVSESQAHINVVGEPKSPDVLPFNPSKAVPFPAAQIPQSADDLYILNMYQDGATYLWALNSTGLMPGDFEDETPILLKPDPGARDNVTITTRNGTWVDLVFITTDVASPEHPIHKHGNKMYLIGLGTGPFEWASVDQARKEKPQLFNLVDPLPRDTILTPAPTGEVAWAVVRYQVTNPGPWLLHCHINNHMMGGMSMVIQDGIDAWPEMPNLIL
jgi:FtsP/CotA-like multicopper oxidase with cupredoxin domain